MATTKRKVKAVIQFRRATESEWIENDPILRIGEPAFSTDVGKIKIGDGIKKWSLLPYNEANNYYDLENLPSINETTLIGDMTSSDLGLQDKVELITEQDIDRLIFGGL